MRLYEHLNIRTLFMVKSCYVYSLNTKQKIKLIDLQSIEYILFFFEKNLN